MRASIQLLLERILPTCVSRAQLESTHKLWELIPQAIAATVLRIAPQPAAAAPRQAANAMQARRGARAMEAMERAICAPQGNSRASTAPMLVSSAQRASLAQAAGKLSATSALPDQHRR